MTERSGSEVIQIGAARLDRAAGTLARNGELVPLRAKTYALLGQLVENPRRVLGKDELLSSIWPDVIVSEDSLTQAIRDLRKALGDEEQKFIRTVPKRGYMYVPDAQALPAEKSSNREPRVAVLPFELASAEPSDRILIDGIVEEITTGLARFRSVTVIARSSAFAFPAEDRPALDAVGNRLGAEYLVEGAMRRIGRSFRISVALVHVPGGRQIWSEAFDCDEKELLKIDTLIARQIIARLVANIEDAVIRSTSGIATDNLHAFENLMRGIQLLRGYGPGVNEAARDCFLKAIEADPEYGLAHAYLGLAEIIIGGYAAAPGEVLDRARDMLVLALRLSPQEPRCHRIMGLLQLYLMEHATSERYFRRAYDLNPYDADTLAQFGYLLVMRGQAEESLQWTSRAIELNPFRPPWYDDDIYFTYYALGRYRDAIDALLNNPEHGPYKYARMAAAYAMVDDFQHAADCMRRVFEVDPGIEPLACMRENTEFEHESDLRHLLDGIARAIDALEKDG